MQSSTRSSSRRRCRRTRTLAERVLEAGKHCFVEKPLAIDVVAAERAVAAARDAGRVLMVGHLLEYHPAVAKLKAVADAGELGDIHYIYSQPAEPGQAAR